MVPASDTSNEKNVKKESKGESDISGNRQPKKINATASSVGKSYNKQPFPSSKDDKLKTTKQFLPAREDIKAVEAMPNVVAKRKSQKYKRNVSMLLKCSWYNLYNIYRQTELHITLLKFSMAVANYSVLFTTSM